MLVSTRLTADNIHTPLLINAVTLSNSNGLRSGSIFQSDLVFLKHLLEDVVRVRQQLFPYHLGVALEVHRDLVDVRPDLLNAAVHVARVRVRIVSHDVVNLLVLRAVLEEVPDLTRSQVSHEAALLVLQLRDLVVVLGILGVKA